MPSLAILAASFLATLSLASPTNVAQQTLRQTSLCPWNGVPNASNFTLLSVSKADTGFQRPLALWFPVLSAVAFLGSAESIDSIQVAQDFVMIDGRITAYAPNGGGPVGVSNPVENENGRLSFHRFNDGGPAAGVYCELFNTSPHGVEYPYTLAVNGGDSDNFSLCKRSTSDEFVVIYNAVEASSENAGYEWTTCTAVDVHVLPVNQ